MVAAEQLCQVLSNAPGIKVANLVSAYQKLNSKSSTQKFNRPKNKTTQQLKKFSTKAA